MQGSNLLGAMLVLLGTPLVVAGALGLLWSLVCFLGGPDGKIGSWESLVFGAGFFAVSSAIAAVGVYFARIGIRVFRRRPIS